jgi:hypothetical protein
MNRKPVSWNQYWMPRAIKEGVEMVEGDHYYAARTSAMGAGAFYSKAFDGWIHYFPFEDGKKKYFLADHGYKPSEAVKDGVTTTVDRKKHHYSQEELAAEFARLRMMGASDKSRRVDGKDINYFVAEQERTAGWTDSDQPVTTPAVAEQVDQIELTELREKIWDWFENHIQNWNFTDEEKAELTAEMDAIGIQAPQVTYLVQVSVPKGMTQEEIRNLLHTNKIEVSEISA